MRDLPPDGSPADVEQRQQLHDQAQVVLAGEALGRSRALEQLFRFLLTCSLDGRSPKELEIANEVFGRSGADQDASVRVHVLRLRRKLEEFYAGAGVTQSVRLTIPKGGYRLIAEPMPTDPSVPPSEPQPAGLSRRGIYKVLAGAAATLLLVVVGVGLWTANRPAPVQFAFDELHQNILWKSMASNARPVIIVVGDYYIFGERNASGEISRLIREFDVNSPMDLEKFIARHPDRAKNYVDLGLDYLPVGVGTALRRVVPVTLSDPKISVPTRVVPASRLTPDMLKSNDILYLGYLSGLGSLRDPVFSNSRFAIGSSYDEIIDRKTGRHFVSDSHLARDDGHPSQDYAIVSSFVGVSGNRLVIIAGTRDAALMQASDFVTKYALLRQITDPLGGAPSFEALLAVESLNNEGLRAHLVITTPRPKDTDWSGKRSQIFPDDLDASDAKP